MLSLLTRCRRVVTEESGQAAVLAVICLFMVMGAMALAIDVGIRPFRQRQLQTAADSAATRPVWSLATAANGLRQHENSGGDGFKRRWHYRRHDHSDNESCTVSGWFEFSHDH